MNEKVHDKLLRVQNITVPKFSKQISQSSLPEQSHTEEKLLGTGPKLKRTRAIEKRETPDRVGKEKGIRPYTPR